MGDILKSSLQQNTKSLPTDFYKSLGKVKINNNLKSVIMAKDKKLAISDLNIEFAVLILGMNPEMLPNLDDLSPDMYGAQSFSQKDWAHYYSRQLSSLVERRILDHPTGQYLSEKGYSIYEIWLFINQLRSKELSNALDILLS